MVIKEINRGMIGNPLEHWTPHLIKNSFFMGDQNEQSVDNAQDDFIKICVFESCSSLMTI